MDFARVGSDVCKRVEDMGELLGWEILRTVLPGVDGPGILLAHDREVPVEAAYQLT